MIARAGPQRNQPSFHDLLQETVLKQAFPVRPAELV